MTEIWPEAFGRTQIVRAQQAARLYEVKGLDHDC